MEPINPLAVINIQINNKYTNLSDKQQSILREYINSVDNSEKLKNIPFKAHEVLMRDIDECANSVKRYVKLYYGYR